MNETRFTVKPRFFLGMLRPWPRWCHECNPDGRCMGGGCRFRYGHRFPHEDFTGMSWPVQPGES